ncbi:hypothetical protein GCM10010156_49660 [Planobispora rosea]|uniref:Uncharacterized protein n=1 Tax=Planobispora rosea TaxID=35762 RepID=A0A8J3WF39_PLARO|nr:hypothetical protein [Planobispora rosea]GGS85119.1 hypothetical protein GCM10010156_49660 [Planobispora rosea]GIH86477.1 hypothetical protein Pro02_48850 [Planobispora rosea]
MTAARTYVSVDVRTTGQPGLLVAVGRLHLELDVLDTDITEYVPGRPRERGPRYDPEALDLDDPVEAVVLRVWERVVAEPADPLDPMRAALSAWQQARVKAAHSEAPDDHQRADDLAHEVAELFAPYFLPSTDSPDSSTAEQQSETERDALVAHAEELGLTPDDLFGLVHDIAGKAASEANNNGLHAQIAHLIAHLGAEQTRGLLDQEQPSGPSASA